jgi:hypothetical protein
MGRGVERLLTALRVLIFLLFLVVPVFCIWTAVRAFRSPIRHPILWALVCTLCAPTTSIELPSRKVTTNPFFILILGLGVPGKPGDEAAVVQFGFPAGAMLFLSRRRKLIGAHRPLMPTDQLP